jgi:hypothetical protein
MYLHSRIRILSFCDTLVNVIKSETKYKFYAADILFILSIMLHQQELNTLKIC